MPTKLKDKQSKQSPSVNGLLSVCEGKVGSTHRSEKAIMWKKAQQMQQTLFYGFDQVINFLWKCNGSSKWSNFHIKKYGKFLTFMCESNV